MLTPLSNSNSHLLMFFQRTIVIITFTKWCSQGFLKKAAYNSQATVTVIAWEARPRDQDCNSCWLYCEGQGKCGKKSNLRNGEDRPKMAHFQTLSAHTFTPDDSSNYDRCNWDCAKHWSSPQRRGQKRCVLLSIIHWAKSQEQTNRWDAGWPPLRSGYPPPRVRWTAPSCCGQRHLTSYLLSIEGAYT